MSRRILVLAALVSALVLGCATGETDSDAPAQAETPAAETSAPQARPGRHLLVLETRSLRLDGLYPSMEGPYDRILLDTSALDWVTAFRTEVVDADTNRRMGDEFFCHAQVQLQNTTRLMVTATGSQDIVFPDGFGMPVNQILGGLALDQREVSLFGMLLNNHQPRIDRNAKVRWSIEYASREEARKPPGIRKLYKASMPMIVEDIAAYEPAAEMEADVDADVATACVLVEGLRTHWLVPPGPQVTRKTYFDIFPVDGIVHYAIAHMHNYGVYMRVKDLATGEVLWRTDVAYESDRKQISEIPSYSDQQGFAVYAGRGYEIEAFYENDTAHDTDAMAVMDFYYHPVRGENITYPTGPGDRPAHL